MSSPPTPTPTPTLPRIVPSQPTTITTEPLTPAAFSPFGTAILSPLPQHLRHIPSVPPNPLHPPHQPPPQPANQHTALKTSPISPLINTYPAQPPSHGQVSIFSCFPRTNTAPDPVTGHLTLPISILERHPYTTQTFCPFNFSAAGPETQTYFLVVVAPSLSGPGAPPDLSRVRAFVAPVVPEGGLGAAVTYAAGTWHAPMVVLGDRRVDFLVTQFANGVGEMDCQEVLVGEDMGRRVVKVDLAGLGLGGVAEDTGLWRAKL